VGLMDHRKTWRFRLRATPEQCVAKFTEAFSGSARIMVMGRPLNKVKANWSIRRSPSGAVATYEGRAGIGAALGMASSRAQAAEAESALGSEVTFEVEESSGDSTVCAMWLSSNGTMLGTTADARFIRPYLPAVEARLRELDPALEVAKA
jgi:hypothetical protein